jgi:hypothetical protein
MSTDTTVSPLRQRMIMCACSGAAHGDLEAGARIADADPVVTTQ